MPNLDAHSNSPSAYDTFWVSFDRLTYFNDKLQPQPMLAESWDLSPDWKQVTFHLRKGVTFHTGREFTSDDVKYNLLRVRDSKIGAGGWVAFSSSWTTIDTPDKNTLVLKSDQSRPLLFDNLETFNIIDRETAEGPDAKSKIAGTGPYIFQEWVQGDHINLAKNKNYWGGAPLLDGIQWVILKDAQAMVTQLEAGALHVALNAPLRDTARLKADPKYQAISNPYSGRYYVAGWNVTNKPLDNKLVRQAMNYAMDRKRFVDTLLLGLGEPKTLPWLQGTPAYENKGFTFDLDKAKALLQQAGASGFDMEYLISPNFPELSDLGQIYQADLAKIGVKLTIRQSDSTAFFDAINNVRYPGMYAITQARANLAPGIALLGGGGYTPQTNNEGFKNDAYTQLANATATETDPAKQKQLYSQVNDLLVDQAFCTAIASASPRLLMTASAQGIGYTLHEGFDWNKTWLA
ncbi:MAG: ABC transporter substrate-binding protein [Chloroflexi bacterium]|nr:ABC transporter substrate-binding protein [Chloroflexota bacterium]